VTVEDTATGLLWERKTTQGGGLHNVNNVYSWGPVAPDSGPTGTAYTVFLAGLNEASFATHTNWRLPSISELQSILVGPGVETVAFHSETLEVYPDSGLNGTGQSTTCSTDPCIDPAFSLIGGPTASAAADSYWSSSISGTRPQDGDPGTGDEAWHVSFFLPPNFPSLPGRLRLNNRNQVRAVRTGSCGS
jgi:hypothetical protein